MAMLYSGGLYLNPAFFGSTDALFSVLRDASRYGVMAIGMTFVSSTSELDLSVGSTFGLTATIFGMLFAPTYFDLGVWTAVVLVPRARPCDRPDQRLPRHRPRSAGLHRHADDAVHRPRRHPRPDRRQEHRVRNQGGQFPATSSVSAKSTRFGFNNQIIIFIVIAAVGAVDARLYHDRLDDLCDRRQRAGGALRRHQHPLRAHALLCALLALRGDRGTDECRAEQGRRSDLSASARNSSPLPR